MHSISTNLDDFEPISTHILDDFGAFIDCIYQNPYQPVFDRWFNLFGFLTRSRRFPVWSIV